MQKLDDAILDEQNGLVWDQISNVSCDLRKRCCNLHIEKRKVQNETALTDYTEWKSSMEDEKWKHNQ